MSFPLSPTNGQTTVLNGITYAFDSTDNAWTRVVGSVSTLSISSSTQSTGTTTGALTVTGGLGVGGNINFGGNLYQNGVLFTGGGGAGVSSTGTTSTFTISNTSSSTSTTTGALVVAGGVGVGGNVNIGGTVTGGGIRNSSTSTAPLNPTVGDIWYDTATDDIYRYTSDGTSSYWLDITGPTISSGSSSGGGAGYDVATDSTGYFAISIGTTGQRPVSPSVGMLRYNTTVGTLEQYNINGWESIGGNKPVIAGASNTIYTGVAGATTISGNYFGLNAVTVRFSYGTTITDVSITPSVTTSITVNVPSSIYNLAAGTTGNVSVIDSAGIQSNGFAKNISAAPGSATAPAASPYAIRQAINATPTAGVYWFSNAGYNSGAAFQAYADWSIDATYGMMVLCGYNKADNNGVSFTDFGTAATVGSGTPGFRTTHYLPSYNILSGWSGNARDITYLGMTSQTGGTTIGNATQKEWLAMGTSLSVLRSMFDNNPTAGEFDVSDDIVNTSSGSSGRLYWTTNHGNGVYQMTSAGNTVNSNLWFEASTGGDANHSLMVWGAGNGAYAASNPPFTTRWMFLAISPDNL